MKNCQWQDRGKKEEKKREEEGFSSVSISVEFLLSWQDIELNMPSLLIGFTVCNIQILSTFTIIQCIERKKMMNLSCWSFA
jgi:hypothetical protein